MAGSRTPSLWGTSYRFGTWQKMMGDMTETYKLLHSVERIYSHLHNTGPGLFNETSLGQTKWGTLPLQVDGIHCYNEFSKLGGMHCSKKRWWPLALMVLRDCWTLDSWRAVNRHNDKVLHTFHQQSVSKSQLQRNSSIKNYTVNSCLRASKRQLISHDGSQMLELDGPLY